MADIVTFSCCKEPVSLELVKKIPNLHKLVLSKAGDLIVQVDENPEVFREMLDFCIDKKYSFPVKWIFRLNFWNVPYKMADLHFEISDIKKIRIRDTEILLAIYGRKKGYQASNGIYIQFHDSMEFSYLLYQEDNSDYDETIIIQSYDLNSTIKPLNDQLDYPWGRILDAIFEAATI